MARYIVTRLLGFIPLLLGVSMCSYALMALAPGGPAGVLSGMARRSTLAERTAIADRFGLNQPWYVQYLRWLEKLTLHHDLGISYIDGRPVLEKILEKLPVTLEVVGIAFVLTLVLAVPLAVAAAAREDSLFDHIATFLAFVGYCSPSFWIASMLLEVFAVQLRWLPASGLSDIGVASFDLGDHLRHLILPVATLTIVGMGSWMRYQRSAMVEVLGQDFIRTARAKGLAERVILFRHALPNAVLPVITLFGLFLPAFVVGSYFVESIFSLPGMGSLGLNAILERDYPTIMGTTFLTALMVAVGNLMADVACTLVDPRIRYA